MLAQNNTTVNYVEQASLCAMSIKHFMPDSKIALITNDTVETPFDSFFDHIVPIPWGDNAKHEEWKVHNRWKIIHCSPFDDAIILDTDMIVTSDISKQCEFLKSYDIFYTNSVLDYRGNRVTDDFYRKTFVKHNIPSFYTAFSYFKKSDFSYKFYEMIELISKNWKDFYQTDKGMIQKHFSMDTTVGLAAKILDCEYQVSTSKQYHTPTFVHMKPNIQGWERLAEEWQTKVGAYVDQNLNLHIGNYKQSGLFHYTENNFVTPAILKQYCKKHGVEYEI